MHQYDLIIILAFIAQGIGLFLAGFRMRGSGIRALGRPTIRKAMFYNGKIAVFTCWGLCLAKAIVPSLGWITVPEWLSWTGAVVMCISTVILIAAFFGLNDALRVGLPLEDTSLMTKGIYRFSRNPIYLGVFGVCLASCLFFPHPLNILLAAYGIWVHHNIVLGEEKFLGERFGEQWKEYRLRVRRYL